MRHAFAPRLESTAPTTVIWRNVYKVVLDMVQFNEAYERSDDLDYITKASRARISPRQASASNKKDLASFCIWK